MDAYVSIVALPSDLLRALLLSLDRCSQLVCRQVSRRFASVLPPRALQFVDGSWTLEPPASVHAAAEGRGELAYELLSICCSPRAEHFQALANAASCSGCVFLLKKLLHLLKTRGWNDILVDLFWLEKAAQNGQLGVLRWADDHIRPWMRVPISISAARGGHLGVLQWLYDTKECKFVAGTAGGAAAGGHLQVLKWLHVELNVPVNLFVMDAAASSGSLPLVQFLRSRGCPWGGSVCASAVKGGHFKLLHWLFDNGCPLDASVCSAAAEGGCLDVLIWAREKGCPWDEQTCAKAATSGHLQVLQWAHAHSCTWNREACSGAAKHGHLAVLQWMQATGCVGWDWEEVFNRATVAKQLQVMQWAVERGFSFSW